MVGMAIIFAEKKNDVRVIVSRGEGEILKGCTAVVGGERGCDKKGICMLASSVYRLVAVARRLPEQD